MQKPSGTSHEEAGARRVPAMWTGAGAISRRVVLEIAAGIALIVTGAVTMIAVSDDSGSIMRTVNIVPAGTRALPTTSAVPIGALGRGSLLQPAAHGELRDQDDVGTQPVAVGGQARDLGGEHPGEHVQRVAVVEAEVGASVHETP